MQQELKDDNSQYSKQQKSRNMNLSSSEHEKQLTMKNINNELSTVSQKNDERKVSQVEIEYLVSQFALVRNKAVNLLRKMDLKQAIRHLVHS